MVKKAAQAKPNLLLRKARLERGWTQKYVAEQIGSPLDLNVTRWEGGTAKPSAHYIQKLCELFGKSPAELGLVTMPEETVAETPPEPEAYFTVAFYRNQFFTGRSRLLEQLREQLHQNRHLALTGLGGIGKTQTAIEFAYRYRDDYSAVFWVRAASYETLVTDYIGLAHLLALPERDAQDQRVIVSAVKRWLGQHEGWLLILDNADDLSLVPDFLPPQGNSYTLLTTRAQATGTLAQNLPVEELNTIESVLLLLRRAKKLAPGTAADDIPPALFAQARTIIEALDGLPLALDQAGAYIEETDCSLADYLYLFRHRQMTLLNRPGTFSGNYPHTVVSTWSISFQRVEQTNPAAAELLRLCAFLDPDIIPEAFLTEGAPELGSVLEPVAEDPWLLNEAIQVLRRYSLIKRDAEAKFLVLHRLVQVVLKSSLDEAAQRLWAERTVRIVNRAFPEVTLDSWKQCETCLPHALVCADLIASHHFIFPEAGRLLHYAGWYLRERGRYEQAEPLLRQALSVREQALGTEHPDTATTLNTLAWLYQNQGKYEQALPLLQHALVIREKTLEPGHPDILNTLNDLGALHYLLSQYEQAETILQRALSNFQEPAETASTGFADTLNNLAMLYQHQGKYQQAEPLNERAFAIYEQALGPEHPYTLLTLNNLAFIYHLEGKYNKAEQLYLRALNVQERTLGKDHPDLATGLNDLASLYLEQGQHEKAESFSSRALVIYRQSFSTEHPGIAAALNIFASLALARGQTNEAEEIFLQALSVHERTLGTAHPRTALTLNNLARLYVEQGRHESASELLQRAMTICEQSLGLEHPETAVTIYNVAYLASLRGDYEQALSFYQRALAIRQQSLGPEHPDTRATRESLTRLQRAIASEQQPVSQMNDG